MLEREKDGKESYGGFKVLYVKLMLQLTFVGKPDINAWWCIPKNIIDSVSVSGFLSVVALADIANSGMEMTSPNFYCFFQKVDLF